MNDKKCIFLDPVPDYIKATIDVVIKIHENEPFGDILAFLTGQVVVFFLHLIIIKFFIILSYILYVCRMRLYQL